MTVAKVKTTEGWSDLHVVGPPGPQGPAGSPLAMIESTTPPLTPAVGDIWLYHPQVGVTWLMRYEPDQDATYPWQFIGGSEARVFIYASVVATVFGAWQDLGGPAYTPGRSCVYTAKVQHHFANAAADWASGHMCCAIGGTTPPAEHTKVNAHYNAGGNGSGSWEKEVICAAGTELRAYYYSSNVNANPGLVPGHLSYMARSLYVQPLRIA